MVLYKWARREGSFQVSKESGIVLCKCSRGEGWYQMRNGRGLVPRPQVRKVEGMVL